MWTVDTIASDYGLDERVEIFADGRATGLAFYVQLKATDSQKGRTVRVTSDHLGYWNALSDPVLLVLWHSPSERLYIRWAHHHHPFVRSSLAGRLTPGRLPKTQTIRFEPSDLWNPPATHDIIGELHFLDQVRGGRIRLPIDVGVSKATSGSPTAGEFDRFVERASALYTDLHVHAGTEISGRPHFWVGARHLQMQLGRVGLSLVNTEPGRKLDVADEVGPMLGLGLCVTGSTGAGIELIRRFGARSHFLRTMTSQPMPLLQNALLKADRPDVSIFLASSWLEDDDETSRVAALTILAQEAVARPGLLDEDRATITRLLTEHLGDRSTVMDELADGLGASLLAAGHAARASDVLGNLVAWSGGVDGAAPKHLQASALADLAAGRLASSIEKLERVVTDAPTDEARWGLVLAYQRAGRYADARGVLPTIANPRFAGRVRLAALILGLAMFASGSERQVRDSAAVDRLARSVDEHSSTDEVNDAFAKAVLADAASPNAWRMLLIIGFSQGGPQIPRTVASAAMAYFSLDDPEWFAIAVVEALRGSQSELHFVIAEAALELDAGGFIDALENFAYAPAPVVDSVKALQKMKTAGLAIEVASPPVGSDATNENLMLVTGVPTFEMVLPDVDLSALRQT